MRGGRILISSWLRLITQEEPNARFAEDTYRID